MNSHPDTLPNWIDFELFPRHRRNPMVHATHRKPRSLDAQVVIPAKVGINEMSKPHSKPLLSIVLPIVVDPGLRRDDGGKEAGWRW